MFCGVSKLSWLEFNFAISVIGLTAEVVEVVDGREAMGVADVVDGLEEMEEAAAEKEEGIVEVVEVVAVDVDRRDIGNVVEMLYVV